MQAQKVVDTIRWIQSVITPTARDYFLTGRSMTRETRGNREHMERMIEAAQDMTRAGVILNASEDAKTVLASFGL